MKIWMLGWDGLEVDGSSCSVWVSVFIGLWTAGVWIPLNSLYFFLFLFFLGFKTAGAPDTSKICFYKSCTLLGF